MTDGTRQQLQQAYQYIKEKKFFEARAILLPLVQQDRENVDAWWLLANAQTDPVASRDALQIILKLKPDHANAKAMLERINAKYPPAPAIPEPPPAPAVEADPFADLSDPFSGTPAPAAPTFGSPTPGSLDDLLAEMNTPNRAVPPKPAYSAPPVAPPVPRYTEKPKGGNRLLYVLLGVFGTLVIGCLLCIGIITVSVKGVVDNPTFQAAISTVGGIMQLPNQLPANVVNKGIVSSGQTVSDTVSANSYNTHTYSATEGETITIRVTADDSKNSFILFGLYDGKTKKKIAGSGLFDMLSTAGAGKTPSPNSLSQLNYTFTSSGTYTILVSGVGTRTNYSLVITSDKQ